MSGVTLEFSRDFDLPPRIVWDALVDPDLLEGWLAAATVDARIGGEYSLRWIRPAHLTAVSGEVAELREAERLVVGFAGSGRMSFLLHEIAGGTRGSSARLGIVIESVLEPRFAPGVIAHWHSNLEQLEALLRGHPVDWANWERDRAASWSDHFDRAVRDGLR